MVKNDNLWLKFNQSTQCVVQLMVILVKAWLNWLIFNHGIGALLKYLTIGYQFKMAARHVLSVMPPVQNRKPARVFRAIELRANWLEIEVSEVDGISNEIEFLLPFTLFKTVHYICAEKSYICAHNTITFAFIFSR